MNHRLLTLLLAAAALTTTAEAQLRLDKASRKVRITVTNPSDETRTDEPVVVAFPEGKYRSATVFDGKREVPSQVDDLDQNGLPEELAFVIDLKPGETKTLTLRFSEQEEPAGRYPARVHAQMFFRDKEHKLNIPTDTASSPTGDLYNRLHHHGPAFESELMAYRLYFDRKQTVDLYGKYHKGLELAESLWYPTDEQLARGFGDDILRVSGSVGIGTLKGWNGSKAIHINPVKNREARILAKGPVRTVVDMNVSGWNYNGAPVDVKSRFTLYAGQRECEVLQKFALPGGQCHVYATGVQKIADSRHISDHRGMTAVWGTDWPVNDTVKYAKQTVGLAVEIPEEYLAVPVSADKASDNPYAPSEVDDKVNYLYLIKPDANGEIRYRMTVCAEKEDFGVKTADDFFRYVEAWKEKQPVVVKKK
jgi:hypothetical protein